MNHDLGDRFAADPEIERTAQMGLQFGIAREGRQRRNRDHRALADRQAWSCPDFAEQMLDRDVLEIGLHHSRSRLDAEQFFHLGCALLVALRFRHCIASLWVWGCSRLRAPENCTGHATRKTRGLTSAIAGRDRLGNVDGVCGELLIPVCGRRSMVSITRWNRSISFSTVMSNGVVMVPSS